MADANLFFNNGATPATLDAFQGDLYTLSATVAIPIKIPPAPAGLLPDVKLLYSSAAAQSVVSELYPDYQRAQASAVGLGWSIANGGYIDTADNTHFAYLVLSGVAITYVRSSASDGSLFRAQVEDFSKLRYYSTTEGGIAYRYFKLWDRDGTEYRFGHEQEIPFDGPPQYRQYGSRQDTWWGYEDANGWHCFPYPKRYYLDRVTDVHGNVMTISYEADQWDSPDGGHYEPAVYPTRIDYTTNNNVGARTSLRRVELVYASRTINNVTDVDWVRDAHGYDNQHFWETRRLSQIKVYGEEYSGGSWTMRLIRQYDLSHDYVNGECSDQYGRQQRWLRLTGVTESDGNGDALPTMSFGYTTKECWTGGLSTLPLLTSASNGYGASVTWDYSSYVRTTGLGSNQRIKYWAVQTRTVVDGVGNSYVTAYAPLDLANPSGALAAWSSKFDAYVDAGNGFFDYWHPSFRGFSCVKVTEPTGHIHEHRFYRGLRNNDSATVTRSDQTTLPDYEEFKGKSFEVRWFQSATEYGNNAPLAKEWYTYSTDGGNAYVSGTDTDHRDRKIYVVFLTQQKVFRGASASLRTFEYDTSYQNGAQYGNLTDVKEYADAAGNWTRHTRRWYYPKDASSTANGEPFSTYIVAKVAREDLYRYGDVLERFTFHLYDSNTSWAAAPVDRGLLKLTRQQVAANKYVDTDFDYDVYGHLTSTTRYAVYGTDTSYAKNIANNDPRSNSVGYNSQYLFVATETNELSYTTQKGYYTSDAKFGLPHTVTDLNGSVTTLDYDGHSRLTSVVGPMIGSSYRKELLIAYGLPVTASGRTTTRVLRQTRMDHGGTPAYFNEYRFYDGAGRLLQEYSDAVGGHVVINRTYDGQGRILTLSVPHLLTGLNGAFADSNWVNNAERKSSHAYDALNRQTRLTLPNSKVTENRYDGFEQVVVDENSHVKRFVRDGLGRLGSVIEYTGTDGNLTQYAVTQYGYNVADQLASVTDASNNTTSIGYDMAGRKTSLTDPDMGSWSYEYNPDGTLKTQADAKGQTIYFYYDKLRRPVRKWYPICWTEEHHGGIEPADGI